MPEIQRPLGRDVTKRNPVQIVYILGDEFTDGSVRCKYFGNFTAISVELRALGVWNLGNNMNKIVCLGNDLHQVGLGRFLGLSNVTSTIKAIVPESEFTDLGSGPSRTIIFNAKTIRQVIQSDDSTEFITSKISDDNVSPTAGLRDAVYIKTGSVGADQDVEFTLYNGTSESDPLFYQATYPASLFPANSEVRIPLDPLVDFPQGDNVHSVLETLGGLSYLGSVAGNRWLALDIQTYVLEDLVSLPTGSDRYISDQFGDMVVDQLGNIIYCGTDTVPV